MGAVPHVPLALSGSINSPSAAEGQKHGVEENFPALGGKDAGRGLLSGHAEDFMKYLIRLEGIDASSREAEAISDAIAKQAKCLAQGKDKVRAIRPGKLADGAVLGSLAQQIM